MIQIKDRKIQDLDNTTTKLKSTYTRRLLGGKNSQPNLYILYKTQNKIPSKKIYFYKFSFKKIFLYILKFHIKIRIGTSTRDNFLKRSMKENVPGPGNYNYHTERTMPSYRFGTEARDKKMTNTTPGPGQYHIPVSIVDVPRYLTTGGGFNASFRYI